MSATCQKLPKTVQIQKIDFKESFEQLSEEESNYIYYLSKACWAGQPIVLFQTSYESPGLFMIFQLFFSSFNDISEIKAILLKDNISDIDYNEFLKYAACFYSNFGNYNLFKKKFFPSISLQNFEEILRKSSNIKDILSIWDIIKYIIYDDSENVCNINLEDKNGKNCYYFGGIKEEQIRKTDELLKKHNYSLLNTRLLLNSSKIVTLIGSIEEKQNTLDEDTILLYGEYSPFLKKINEYLENAKKYAPKDSDKKILNDYIQFFTTGDIQLHKETQIEWVKENSCSIDFNMGWNETMLDPIGVRGIFEGFVAMGDNFRSQKFEQLIKLLPQLMTELPWDENFQKDINSVQFNSMEVVCFSRNGCPYGKSLPKYYDVKEKYGVKNILFFNAYSNYNLKENDFSFIDQKDIELINNFGKQATNIMTSIKQLMGYGSGKLLRVVKSAENNEEIRNFNKDLINPLTDKVIDKYYINNETFEEKFTFYSTIIDECRALLIGLYFSNNESIQNLFYVNKIDYKSVTYTIWLLFLVHGLSGLKMYIEKSKSWAHQYSQSACIIIKYILENQKEGEEIIKIDMNEEKDTFKIKLNKEAILISANAVLAKLMLKFHIWKCIGDVESAKEFIDNYSQLDDKLLKIKKCVENDNDYLILFLYHNLTREEDGTVTYKEYEENYEGIIESNLDRFGIEYNKDVYAQWVKYATNFIKN